jgi:hypothetical protein
MNSPNSPLDMIPLRFVLPLVGIELTCEFFHGSVIVTCIITSKPTNLEWYNYYQ